MLRSLVGSEMCIRDRVSTQSTGCQSDVAMTMTINRVLGDASWTRLEPPSDDKQRIQAHLEYVLRVLQDGSDGGQRRGILELLQSYIQEGAFPEHSSFFGDEERCPLFIDDAGVPCAVAHLMQGTGGQAVAAQVNQEWRRWYVEDFDLESELGRQVLAWAASVQLTPTELAMIPVSYTHLRAHETPEHLVCRLLLEKKKKN
eukprot:TRINITY_DN14989_c0_g1_i3.p1 TRINITY_DN14989_c0_g1~~TRINITY_DN14989_c0_g1_i3.p1  ORF type:complete len:201 (+),score=78.61 TRINITY_DN14989_c0_g1_i3:120-722(+)